MTITQQRLQTALRPIVRETLIQYKCPKGLVGKICNEIKETIKSYDDGQFQNKCDFPNIKWELKQWIVNFIPKVIVGRIVLPLQ